MKERIVIIFIAVTLGLLATTVAFFLYESAKPAKIIETNEPEPKTQVLPPQDDLLLQITEPKNESITNKRTIQVKGRTNAENTIIISTNSDTIAASPTGSGEFTASISISAGVNKVVTQVVTPDGESKKDTRIVSFSSEEF